MAVVFAFKANEELIRKYVKHQEKGERRLYSLLKKLVNSGITVSAFYEGCFSAPFKGVKSKPPSWWIFFDK